MLNLLVKRRSFVLTSAIAAAYASMKYTPSHAMGYVDEAMNYFNPEEEIPLILNPGTVMRVNYVDTPADTSKVDVGNFLVDNSKLKSLGWTSSISAKDGIISTINYFEKNSL